MKLPILLLAGLLFLSQAINAQTYVEAIIITHQQDTVRCSALKYKNRRQEAAERYFSLQIPQDSGRVKTLYPADISGYILEGDYYRSLRTTSTGLPPEGLFMQQITKGRAELYFHPGYHKEGAKYFFRKSTQPGFLVWTGEIIRQVEEVDNLGRQVDAGTMPSTYSPTYFRVTQNVEAVREYFIKYFADCPLVVNKLKAEFYTDGDVKSMFMDYNQEAQRFNKQTSPIHK